MTPELWALAEGLLRLIGPITQEVGALTGGVKEAGCVVRGGPQGRAAKPQDTGELLRKIRISFSAWRATLVDPDFTHLLQAELCSI